MKKKETENVYAMKILRKVRAMSCLLLCQRLPAAPVCRGIIFLDTKIIKTSEEGGGLNRDDPILCSD